MLSVAEKVERFFLEKLAKIGLEQEKFKRIGRSEDFARALCAGIYDHIPVVRAA